MVNLDWVGKNENSNLSNNMEESKKYRFEKFELLFPSLIKKIKNEQYDKGFNLSSQPKKGDTVSPNLLIYGDNMIILTKLLTKYKKKVDLIYIDPPFFTGGAFYHKIFIGESRRSVKNISYNDKWQNGIESYLNFLFERLKLMKSLLSEMGSIYVHLDWHISHYIKLLMDEIFGIDNFRNEIIWAYPAASAQTKRFYVRSYDAILFYSNSSEYIFNDNPLIYQEYSDRVKKSLKRDEKGLFYYRGGSHNGKKLSRKVYVEENGVFPRDVWKDIPYIRANTSEYQGFSTQKPERLLRRIILASSNRNSIVADFFCGSGTTLAVAEKLGRRWIGVDSNWYSLLKAKRRLLNLSKTRDLLNWKKKFHKEPKPFQICILNKTNSQNIIPKPSISGNLLKKQDNDRNVLPKNNTLIFDIGIRESNNQIKFQLKKPDNIEINFLDTKILNKIQSWEDWIEYWAIDFSLENKIFTPNWISFRTTRNRTLSIETPFIPRNYISKSIKVRVEDIFGYCNDQEFNLAKIKQS